MARKTSIYVHAAKVANDRDVGKIFHLTEMPSTQAERWAQRLFLALARANVQVPPNIFGMGMMGVAAIMVRGVMGLAWPDAQPLLDEMFECIKIQPGPNPAVIRPLQEDDIEEVQTRMMLRSEVIELHTGFSVAAYLSTLAQEQAARLQEIGRNTKTSPEPSPRSSRRASRRATS